MAMSLIVGLSTRNRLTLWLMLEINTILFIAIISLAPGRQKACAIVKYFTIQAMRSMVFIYINAALLAIPNYRRAITLIAFMVKLGMVPIHLWYLSILQDLNWIRIFVLSTVQKLLPLFFLSRTGVFYEIRIIALLSSFAGIWALGVSSLKRLIGYSSVLNIRWLLLSSLAFPVFLQFFLTYFLRILGLVSYFRYFIREKMSDLKKLNTLNDIARMGLLLLRLRAFPPLLGFWAKLFILKFLRASSSVLVIWLLMNTVFIVYTYMTVLDILLLSPKNHSLVSRKFNNVNSTLIVVFLRVFGLGFTL